MIEFLVLLPGTAVKFHSDSEHILNCCYQSSRKYFTGAKCKTTRFLNGSVPYSICLFNERAFLPIVLHHHR